MIKYTLWLLITLSFALQSNAANEFKIFTLQHRFADEILPTIQAIIGNNGTASAIQNQLIIRTDSKTMSEVEQTILTLDTTRENFTIRVKRQNNAIEQDNSRQIKGSTRISRSTIQTGSDINNRDGIQIGYENSQVNVQQNNQQFIQVADGMDAYISVGESISYTSQWQTFTNRYAMNQVTTAFINIGTGFTVRARSIGSQVALEITPSLSTVQKNGRISFDQLTTSVQVTRGEWVNIGGIMQEKDEVSRAILSNIHTQSFQNNQLYILVE